MSSSGHSARDACKHLGPDLVVQLYIAATWANLFTFLLIIITIIALIVIIAAGA